VKRRSDPKNGYEARSWFDPRRRGFRHQNGNGTVPPSPTAVGQPRPSGASWWRCAPEILTPGGGESTAGHEKNPLRWRRPVEGCGRAEARGLKREAHRRSDEVQPEWLHRQTVSDQITDPVQKTKSNQNLGVYRWMESSEGGGGRACLRLENQIGSTALVKPSVSLRAPLESLSRTAFWQCAAFREAVPRLQRTTPAHEQGRVLLAWSPLRGRAATPSPLPRRIGVLVVGGAVIDLPAISTHNCTARLTMAFVVRCAGRGRSRAPAHGPTTDDRFRGLVWRGSRCDNFSAPPDLDLVARCGLEFTGWRAVSALSL
jgi:hypothetical protein